MAIEVKARRREAALMSFFVPFQQFMVFFVTIFLINAFKLE